MRLRSGFKMRSALLGAMVSMLAGGIFGLTPVRPAAAGTWRERTPMPTPRWLQTCAVVNGRIYVIGGASSEPIDSENEVAEVLSTVEEYDLTTDAWTRKADMPTARGWLPPSSPVVDGKIYVIGGSGDDEVVWDLPTVEVYDPATNTWESRTDMTTARWCLGASAVNGRIYAIGGAPSRYYGLTVVEVYDPRTDTWTTRAGLPKGVWGLSTSVVNGQIYATGGAGEEGGGHIGAQPSVQKYDPVADTWAEKADLPLKTRNHASSVLCGKIYAMGGWVASSGQPRSAMQVYDPLLDEWRPGVDLPVGKAGLSSCAVNGKIYAIGGTPVPHPCVATSTVYEYDADIAYAPSADFNGNGQVDVNDLVRMIESWGQDDPLVDLGPCACSDGMVDVADLEILMSLWGQQVYDSTLMAHWTFDETEGDVACDRAHDHDGLLIGDPVWQPDAGRVDGALQLDGVDDYVELPYSPNPRREVFSVFAWVRNGAAGEVILSQATGNNWLRVDPDGDRVMTELRDPFWPCDPLRADVCVTDGDWHRVGLVWDGTHRTLYIDDLEVARDEEPIAFPVGASGHLCIGCGADQSPDAFFSGLIDDVRLYNRAVKP